VITAVMNVVGRLSRVQTAKYSDKDDRQLARRIRNARTQTNEIYVTRSRLTTSDRTFTACKRTQWTYVRMYVRSHSRMTDREARSG